MATPAIQTLLTDAQQVLNLNSLSEVRSTMAAALANANVGTPLNPNLTTQQLWDEFYLIVRQPESDIESIITNQLMKFLFAPPAPGGAGANHEVIYNNNGVLAGDSKFLWDDALNKLDIDGSATISGDLTVRTTRLTTTTTGVGIGTATPILPLDVRGTAGAGALFLRTTDPTAPVASAYIQTPVSTGFSSTVPMYGFWYQNCGMGNPASENLSWIINSSEAMRLNSTGLGVGASPSYKLEVVAPAGDNIVSLFRSGDATAANNAGGGFRSISSATAANRVAQVWLDADGADFSSGDYFFIQKNGNSGTVEFNQSSNAAMTFLTNGTERARIDASGNLILQSSATPATLGTNGMLTVNATSNTNLRFSYRGSDGTTRVANITLA
jgi:hypothetical protein